MRLWDQEAEPPSAPLLGVPFYLFFSLGDTFFSGRRVALLIYHVPTPWVLVGHLAILPPHWISSLLWMSLSPSQPLGEAHNFNPLCAKGKGGDIQGYKAIKLAMYTEHSREKATPGTGVSGHSGSWGLELR